MQIVFAGTRGSMPTCVPNRALFGGDTTCFVVRGEGGEQVVIDAGSGLRHATDELPSDRDLHVLLTHFHLDHLLGLVTFAPLYTPGRRVVLAAVPIPGCTVAALLSGLLGPPYWPVAFGDLPASIECVDLTPAASDRFLAIGGLEVRWTPVPHPGGSTAYRIDEPATGHSVTVATDAEWSAAEGDQRERFVALARDCDLLIGDGQYDDHEADKRRGWGHSTWHEAVALAQEAGARRLVITHHDPEADDAILLAREEQLQAMLPSAVLARQFTALDLAGKDSL